MARLLHVDGQLHAQKGEQGSAHELDEALAILRRLGARVDAERVEQTIVSLAHAPGPVNYATD